MTCALVDFSTCSSAILCCASCPCTIINIKTHTAYVVAVCVYSVDVPVYASMCRVRKLPLASVAVMSTVGLQQEAVYAIGTFAVVPAIKLVRISTPTGKDVTLMSPGIKSNA